MEIVGQRITYCGFLFWGFQVDDVCRDGRPMDEAL